MASLLCHRRQRPPPKKSIPYAWIYPPPRAQQRPPTPRNLQNQSPLFGKLPLDLRLKIFRLALYCSPIHVFVQGLPRYIGLPHPAAGGPQVGSEVTAVLEARLLSLLLTCSRAYAEALPVLYSVNTFSPCSPDTVALLANTSYMSWIRRLEYRPYITSPPIVEKLPRHHLIDRWLSRKYTRRQETCRCQWLKVWEDMRKLEGLQWLYIELYVDASYLSKAWREHEMEVLMPLRGLLNDGAYGKLAVTWNRPEAQGSAAEDILEDWVIERRVCS
ncbi:hypothetical protein F5B19DRAFT_472067 [Rostrohypoxylon terebratum]|nr:hypothetical protein F5B19DRAFT_472067 [Rostrohypoxylon terebratum]